MKPVISNYDNLTDEDYRLIEVIGWQGKIVKHFKGNLYLILDTHVQHTETDERMIQYKALYGDCQVYVRPASMFIEKCSEEQYREYGKPYRFELVELEQQRDNHPSMNEIRMKQYKNLRTCFHKNLVEPILGEGYYNMAMDVYTCDKFTTEDLKREFDSMKSYKTGFFIMCGIFSITLCALLISLLTK